MNVIPWIIIALLAYLHVDFIVEHCRRRRVNPDWAPGQPWREPPKGDHHA